MMQVWLVLLGAVLLWQGDQWARASARHDFSFAGNVTLVLFLLGWCSIILSVFTFFINGGTTG